ncbi:quorum-sensing autoinducer 1 sensor kinase/phosphatase LuxN [Vibrio diabolicus]|uniref:quorum-sensing autoinducer 1 sensor kinase/phosphatase LuxN n=1 Tax=Vibrio diabolicus TaxID=50719 RepID=UPI00215E1E57|nr:response regulator [Vibrio diabolicus]MCS0377671.1 response regulator [Vibrio diabolicus]MCS0423274.1 response regulator [Vibrio diabolicus]
MQISKLPTILILYPKATALLLIVLLVFIWLIYYCIQLTNKEEKILGTYHFSYIAYSACIIGWIISNAYFHTNFLPKLGADFGIVMARVANITSSLAFCFAYYFSCQLSAEQRKSNIYLWQRWLITIVVFYSISVNITPGLTVENISIINTSQFIIEFGNQTPYFFFTMFCLMILCLGNLITMRKYSNRLALAKTSYMIAGILVYMLSTVVIQIGITYFLKDFSLTWLPPALSVSEMLFVGYALLTSRFYSIKYLAYLILSALFACMLLTIPLGIIFIPLSDNVQWLVAIPICALIGMTWRVLYEKVGYCTALLIYGTKKTPVQKILELEKDFKISIDDAMRRLGTLLQIPDDKLRLVTSNYNEAFYERYLSSNRTVLILDELSQELEHKISVKNSIKVLYDRMSSNDTALVMPLFGHCKSVSHFLVSPHKLNNQMFCNEEISALQTLLTRIQSSIEADRRIRQSHALANSIAHEMRNPLAQVQLQLETLKQHIESNASLDTLKREIDKGEAAIQRGRQLIDIILREVSDCSPEHEHLDITSIHKAVDQAVSRYGFENDQIIERINLPQEHDFVVKLNETLFNFVIFNLIRNAIYYFDSYPDSQIEIRTQTGAYENVLIFRDSGPGIDSSILHKIFDEFFSYQKSGGSGLGLGYCQRVMRSFGGRIECQSELGEFTEFYLYFPVVPNAPKPETLRAPDFNGWKVNAPHSEPRTTQHVQVTNDAPTVLIVDDKEVQRTLVQMYLKRLGVNSLQANNGASAVELFQSHKIDLVLMDVQMPVMNGFDASQRIKQIASSVPIIALSGESGAKELELIAKLMDDRLEKPTTLNALQTVIKRWLQHESFATSNTF